MDNGTKRRQLLGILCELSEQLFLNRTNEELNKIKANCKPENKNPDEWRCCRDIFYDEVAYKYRKHAPAIIAASDFVNSAGEKCDDAKWKPYHSAYEDSIHALNLQLDIIEKFQQTNDFTTKVFLLGFAIILQYDGESSQIQEFFQLLRSTHNNSNIGYKDLIQRLFTMDEFAWRYPYWGEDPHSEFEHIRNAFAHGHVKLFPRQKEIIVWDQKFRSDEHNFDHVYSLDELINVYVGFEERLNVLNMFIMFIWALALNIRETEA